MTIRTEINYSHWKILPPIGELKKDDWSVAMTLLIEIAALTAEVKTLHQASTEPLPPVSDRIQTFIKTHSCNFTEIFQTGFPFSLLERSSVKTTLKHTLENNNSILFNFMMLEPRWMEEKELDKRFAFPFGHLQIDEITKACHAFKEDYVNNKNNKSGYYLLWLVKQTTRHPYEMPAISSFNHTTVARSLSLLLKNWNFKDKTIFVKTLLESFD